MARAAKKNFLFTEDDEVPAELLAAVGYPEAAPSANAGKPKPQDPEPEEPSDPPAPPPTQPAEPPAPAANGDPEETSPPVREPGEPNDEPDEDEEEDDSGVPTSPGDDEDDDEDDDDDDPKALKPAAAAAVLPRPGGVHYEARITIVDAWQYPGSLKAAPAWVDRNWAAYLDYDALRNIEPGPGLRVPLPSGVTAVVRIGDYLARQEVKLTQDVAEVRLEVWEQTQFEKIFLPTSAAQTPIPAPIAA